MQQLEAKISDINEFIEHELNHLRCDLKGLSYFVENRDEKTRVEAGTEMLVSFDSDSDLTAYHFKEGEIDFSKFQIRGKGKMYYPVASLCAIFMCKDRSLEEKITNILKSIKDITIKSTTDDKYQIWRDETGKSEVNFDYHIFKINYDYAFKTTDCKPYCK